MSSIFKKFLGIVFLGLILLLILDPFSMGVVGIVVAVLLLVSFLIYAFGKKYKPLSIVQEFLLLFTGVVGLGMFFIFFNRVNKIIVNPHHSEFVILFNVSNINAVEYDTKLIIPRSGVLLCSDEADAFDDNTKLVYHDQMIDSGYIFKELIYSDSLKRQVGIVYGGLDYDNSLLEFKDSVVSKMVTGLVSE